MEKSNMAPESRSWLVLKMILTALFWGGTFIAAKTAVQEGPPLTVAAWRFALAASLLMLLVYLQEGRGPGRTLPVPREKREWLSLLGSGATGIFLYNIVFLYGLQQTTASDGSLIVSINPLVTAILSALFLGEPIQARRITGLLWAFAGVLLVISKGSWEMIAGFQWNRGNLILLAGPLAWASYSLIGQRLMDGRKYSPLAATAYGCVVGAVFLMVAAVILDGPAVMGNSFTWKGWTGILQLALLGTVLAFLWWNQGVSRLGVATSALFINLVPLFAMAQAVIFLGEAITPVQISGFLLIIAGVYIGTSRNYGKDAKETRKGWNNPPLAKEEG